MGDLKPCPFCGSTDLRLNEFEQYGICNSCNAFGPSFDIVDECDAIAVWNRRDTQPEVTALVEALRWYAGTVCNCNRHGSDGDMARGRLANDTGNRAREALTAWEAAQK